MKKIAVYYLKPYYLRMLAGFLIKFTGTLMDLFLPWTLAHMIDQVIPGGKKEEIFLWGFFMLICSVLGVTLSVIANRMAARVASDAIYTIRNDLFRKIMYLSNRQVDEITRPSLISRLTSDTYNVHQMLARVQRLGVRAPILLFGGIIMTLILDPVLACVLLATMPLLAAVVFFVSQKSIPMFLELQESVDGFVRLVREDITGIRVIKALSREDWECRRFGKVNEEVVERERKATVTTAVTNPAMNLFLNIGLVFVILAGAYRVDKGLTQVGSILAFLTYFTIILTALMSISKMFIVISRGAASAKRIDAVLEGQEEAELFAHDHPAFGSVQEESEIYLEFDHVSFSYNKSRDNLKDISFRLRKGETLGIIGSTGSGKSTIVSLLMGFYRTEKGTIRIGGQDIRTMNISDLRKRCGAVFQNDVIFEDTVFENISMGRDITRDDAFAAAGFARAREFIEEKGGLDKKLDIRGANLSGGQKQRIFITRALAGHPDILILDDASSALDYKTDGELRKALKENFSDTTCIVVAQRISSIMGADHIMVLEEGNVIGYGKHEELMRDCQVYREIGRSQMEEVLEA